MWYAIVGDGSIAGMGRTRAACIKDAFTAFLPGMTFTVGQGRKWQGSVRFLGPTERVIS